jgi:hypothetical protein
MPNESLNELDLDLVTGGFCATPVPATPSCGTPPHIGPLPMPLPMPGRPPVCPVLPPPLKPHPWDPPAPKTGGPGIVVFDAGSLDG